LSVSTMLVNTNDAFTGIAAAAVADMAVGDACRYGSQFGTCIRHPGSGRRW
jgi:hypothetical protein